MTASLRVGTFLAPCIEPLYRHVAERLAAAVGRRGELVVGEDFGQFAAGELDAGFVCGLPYVDLADRIEPEVELLAAPVLVGKRFGGLPVYFSDVIVRAADPGGSFDELRGRSWCYNDRGSQSGFGVVRAHLAKIGETNGFFRRVVEAGFHERSIELVRSGAIDASAVDAHVLAVVTAERPQLLRELRVIEALGPSPIQPLVAAAGLSGATKTALRSAATGLHRDPHTRAVLRRFLIERLVAVDDAWYDPIRAMTALAQEAGLQTVR